MVNVSKANYEVAAFERPFRSIYRTFGSELTSLRGLILRRTNSQGQSRYAEVSGLPNKEQQFPFDWAMDNLLSEEEIVEEICRPEELVPSSILVPALSAGETKNVIERELAKGASGFKCKVVPQNVDFIGNLVQGFQKSAPNVSWRFDSNGGFAERDLGLLVRIAGEVPLTFWEDPFPYAMKGLWTKFYEQTNICLASDQVPETEVERMPAYLKVWVMKPSQWGRHQAIAQKIKQVREQQNQIYLSSSLESELGSWSLMKLAETHDEHLVKPHGIGVGHLFERRFYGDELLDWLRGLSWRPLE